MNKTPAYRPKRITLYSLCIISMFSAASLSFEDDKRAPTSADEQSYRASQQAFLEVYKVLMSPRCLNCHPAGDVPFQGDDKHLHTMGVQRGEDGKGRYALKCSNCHQDHNTPGLNMPPGNPKWRLPEANMKLVFEGKTPRQLALQLKDRKQNGGKTMEELFHHIAEDTLVLWGWNPGDGRTLPPLNHDEFVKQWREWMDKGTAVPD
ncbi:MAG: isoquinoline 1-oxidoreductase subunit [Segetibacter sp.]|nr:isoquinoline 1-oxidoreductase subunit [Segetibacter sp.]